LASAIVASLYPQFVHVYGERAQDFIPRLFGSSDPVGLKVGILETLLRWARPIANDTLILFRPFILAYLELERSAGEEERQEAVRWLMIGYIRQLADQDDPSALLGVLRRPSRISEGAEFLGRVLRETTDPDPQLIEAAFRFWDEALATPGLPVEAFQGFGWWAEGSAIGDQPWLDRIYTTLQLTGGRIDREDEVVRPRPVKWCNSELAWFSLACVRRRLR
jgi:hypothetical protein